MSLERAASRLRTFSEVHMPLRVEVIEEGEGYTDPGGYYQPGEPYVAQTTKGALEDMSGSEQIIAGRLSERVEGTLLIPADVEAQATQSLRIDGVSYNIVHVGVGTDEYMVERRILVARA